MSNGYAQIDPMLPVHPKVRGLSDSAFRLYISAICWVTLQCKSDCHIPTGSLRYLSDVRRAQPAADELVRAGLWETTPDGWTIPNYVPGARASRKTVKRERKAGVIQLQQRDPA
jgi:hypothetical protein